MHSFVYSNNPRYRLFRHFIFWFCWIAYFMFIYSSRSGSKLIGFTAFIQYTFFELLILLSVDCIFCYSVLYFLIPKILLKKKYFTFFLYFALFLLLDAALSSYFYTWLINPLRKLYQLPEIEYIEFTDLLRGLNGVIMITGVAVSIRFYKMWHIKKQELQLVSSEKISRELTFIDSYIQPGFIPDLLKKIYAFSLSHSNKVSDMLDKLQRIVTYLINDCNQQVVHLSDEIETIRNFIQLEKLINTDRYTIQYNQQGNAGDLTVPPYLLFPFVESNVRQFTEKITDKHWTNIDLQIEGTRILLQVTNSKPVETSNILTYNSAATDQLRKRLEIMYPGSNQVNIIIKENSFTIQLDVDLSKAVN